MESSDVILLFLKKMRLEKYHSIFISHFNIKSIEDCKYLFQNLEDIGFSSTEVNRYKRLYEKALKDCKEEYESQIKDEKNTIQSQPMLIQPSTWGSVTIDEVHKKIEPVKPDPISISYKYLNIDSIKSAKIRNKLIDSSKWKSLRYFELVTIFYELFQEHFTAIGCTSIEIYHRSGYPMVTCPTDYFKLVHEFCEKDDFEFVFILPKRLYEYTFHPSSPNKRRSNFMSYQSRHIPIIHIDSRSNYEFRMFTDNNLRVDELKYECSKRFHLPYSSISICLEYPDQGDMECNLRDNVFMHIDNILDADYKLHFSVGEYFWEPSYLDCFKFDNYFPIIEHTNDTLIYLNVYLLFLARQAHLKSSLDTVISCLGLLRKISCSPPLVYSLWLLFNQKPITLPHKIAIIEGLFTTVKMLDRNTEQFDFSCLWLYLLRKSNSSCFESEQTEIIRSKMNSKNNLFKETDLDKYREYPLNMHDYASFRRDLLSSQSTLFIFQHPIDLYREYLVNGHCNGLTRIQFQKSTLIPCVFSSFSIKSNTPILNCYSPYLGEISFDPYAVGSSEILDINNYSKMYIILDVSNDMNTTLDGLNYIPNTSYKDNVFYQLDTALFLIEIIIDTLISKNLEYLLGITLVSNDHGFNNGYYVFQDLTFEYDLSIQELRQWIRANIPVKNANTRTPQGGISGALGNYLEKKYTNTTEIIIFTNHEHTERFYGSNVHRIKTDILKTSYRVNTIMFGTLGVRFETLCKQSQGSLINSNSFFSKSAKDPKDPMYYFCQFREYVNLTRELLTGNTNPDQLSSFDDVCTQYKDHLSRADDSIKLFHEKHDSSDPQYGVVSSILHTISEYLSNPNPFVSIYSVDDDVTNWLLFLKFPPNTDLFSYDHIISLTFSKHLLYQPPIFKFLTPILHPNIYKNGKICHPILLEDYDPNTTTLKTIIDSIHSMMCKPITTHVINRAIGEQIFLDLSLYNLHILSGINAVCMKSVPRRQREEKLNITSTVSHPEYLVCPLTNDLYKDPVLCPYGNTYERSAILEHLKTSQNDPFSENPLTQDELFPNYAIADCVIKYKMNHL